MSTNSSDDRIRALIALLGDHNWAVQEQASRELLTYDASVVPALLTALGEEATWYGAAETLARFGVLAVEPLIAMLDNPRLANFAVHALTQIGATAVLPLVKSLPRAEAGSEAREWIQLLLKWFSDPTKTENVDPSLRAAAEAALAENDKDAPSADPPSDTF
jgi:HEAT repeat protein